MIVPPDLEKQKVAVFGLGATGMSACEALIAAGAEVFAWDEQEAARARTANTRFAAEHPKTWPWRELKSLVLSPGVPLTHPKPHLIVRKARQESVEIIGDVELFARALNALPARARPRVIAITGSNGKSTTTALTGFVLREAGIDARIGGNIGVPVLSLPETRADAVYVLELSSFQLDLTMSLRANSAVLLNISPDHIDRHGSIDRYVEAKKRIFLNQQADDVAVIGVDDPYCQSVCAALTSSGPARVAPISVEGSLGRGVFAVGGRMFYSFEDRRGEAGDLSGVDALRGRHNWQNACAALAAAMSEGVAPAVAMRAMERFEGLPHRLEVVRRANGVVFVNDSKATNADASSRALSAYNDIFWIAGGKPKEGGVASLTPLMSRVRRAYLIGEATPLFQAQLDGAVECVACGDLATAVARAGTDAAKSGLPGPTVLLSPACASYDQFRNFEERGDLFRRLARNFDHADGAAA